MDRRKLHRSIAGGIALAVFLAAWVAFAPSQLGGQSTYVVVNGNSMEPAFHKGDLVVVREAHNYGPGDVVTYRHPDIGFVIHRIVGRDGGTYLFQGDNNSYVDGYQPDAGELVGRQWFFIPNVGGWMRQLRRPWPLALLTTVAIVGIGGGAFAPDIRRRRGASLLTHQPAMEARR